MKQSVEKLEILVTELLGKRIVFNGTNHEAPKIQDDAAEWNVQIYKGIPIELIKELVNLIDQAQQEARIKELPFLRKMSKLSNRLEQAPGDFVTAQSLNKMIDDWIFELGGLQSHES